ncbi:lysine N(6)-hydroxylase/L-ornithine N(5)-oxygenase family protein [Symbioplanes lichenis]|uniref:lysine N(6)-hydroxylase/L-ornithine N(5)-oxygenase family protein n=1 Tax=Symbioplanes lichenis TaxID=1629072 RepID=UPI002739A90B|nr:SidA/IucD/PvdA family monooxygenase [Actinoplanes lichenis]
MEKDVIGVGFGPANIALAIAIEELEIPLDVLFVERRPRPEWQPGMLLDGSDIQHHPARDLALPSNPRSRYTFFNYLFEEGRLFEFLNLGLPFPLRKDYARYVTWAANGVAADVRYGTSADTLELVDGPDGPRVQVVLDDGTTVRARSAVIAPGRPHRIPLPFREIQDPRVFHFTGYLEHAAELAEMPNPRIAVVGASQSAVELVLDAGRRFPHATVTNILRGFGYRQKDLSPFHGEVYYPEFVNYYFGASEESKRLLDQQLRYTNYSAADIDVLQALYAQLYEQRLDGGNRIQLRRNTDVLTCRPEPGGVRLTLREQHLGVVDEAQFDAVILATGFVDLTSENEEMFLPPLLAPIAPAVARTESGRAVIGRDYRLGTSGAQLPPIFLNGLCETTHGMGDAGSFSLLSLRAATIAESLQKTVAATTEPRA